MQLTNMIYVQAWLIFNQKGVNWEDSWHFPWQANSQAGNKAFHIDPGFLWKEDWNF